MKQLFFSAIFSITVLVSQACDVCGCFMGIVPYDNQSSISLMHRYRVFNGYRAYEQHGHFFPSGAYKTMHGEHGGDSLVSKKHLSSDYESYKVYELRLKYFIHERIELNAFLGFNHNKAKEDTMKYNHLGLNDPSFFIGYHILRPQLEKDWKHRLIAGAGIKMPSGNYYAKDQYNRRLPFLLQPGTGSVDGFLYTSYMIGYKNFGFSTTANFKMNGTNYYGERLANSFTDFASVFYKINLTNWTIVPAFHSYYEYTKGLYRKEKLQKGTEMNEWMFGLGCDLFYKNFGVQLSLQKTMIQSLKEHELSSVGRFTIALTYNFNQRKYLLNRKANS